MISNYYDMTIGQFIKCKAITELESDPLQRNILMLAELSGLSIDEIEALPINKLQEGIKKFASIQDLKPNEKVKMKFKVGGNRFECIWKTQELTAYQYIDFTHYSTDPINNIHNILASICVPVSFWGKRSKYDGAKHKNHAKLFHDKMKIKDAYPIMLFFCTYLAELESNMQTYLIKEVESLKKKVQTNLKKDGD